MPARPPYGPQQQQQLQPAPSPQIPQHAQPAGPVPNQAVVPPTPVATSAQQQQQPHVAPPTIASSNSQPTTGTHPPGQGPPGQQQQPGPNQMPGMPPAAGPNAGAPNPNYPPGPPQNQPDYYRNEQVKFTILNKYHDLIIQMSAQKHPATSTVDMSSQLARQLVGSPPITAKQSQIHHQNPSSVRSG